MEKKTFTEWLSDMNMIKIQPCDNLTINTGYHSVTLNPKLKTRKEIAAEFNRKLAALGSALKVTAPE